MFGESVRALRGPLTAPHQQVFSPALQLQGASMWICWCLAADAEPSFSPPQLSPSPPRCYYQSRWRCLCPPAGYRSPPSGGLILLREATGLLMERWGEGGRRNQTSPRRSLTDFQQQLPGEEMQLWNQSCVPRMHLCCGSTRPPERKRTQAIPFHFPEICFTEPVLTFVITCTLRSL